MIKCSICKKKEGTVKYTKSINHRKNTITHYLICRKCNTERARKYRNTKEGRKKINEAVYRSIKKLWYKQKARLALNWAVKIGKVKKPVKCPVCNKKRKVEGHHKDYSKPLDVAWVCRPCHFNV